MSKCRVCKHRLARAARECPVCGEPAAPASDQVAGLTPAAEAGDAAAASTGTAASGAGGPREGPPPRSPKTAGHRPVRWAALASGVAVAIAGVGTYLLLRGDSLDRAAYSVVRMAPDPGARWQRAVADIAPDLKCQSSSSVNSDPCIVADSVVLSDTVVLVVQRGGLAMLAGLSRKDGTVRWRRAAPWGFTYDCLATEGRLWCLSTPSPSYVVLLPDGRDRGRTNQNLVPPGRGGSATAVLAEIIPGTGATARSRNMPAFSSSVKFAGVGDGGLYVVAESSVVRATVLRYSALGQLQWSHPVVLRSDNGPSVGSGLTPPVRVSERDGRSYVSAAQMGDHQAVFDTTSGAPVGAEKGHVAAVVGATVVTQVGSGGLMVHDIPIGGNLLARLSANDHSVGEPVITGYEADVNDLPYPQGPYTIRSPTDPKAASGTMKAGESPVAYCRGVVIGHALRGISGYNARTGERSWTIGFDEGSSLDIRCDGTKVLISDGVRVTAFETATGDDMWSVLLPGSTRLTGGGFGDPATALVAGPGELDFGSSMPTVALVQ